MAKLLSKDAERQVTGIQLAVRHAERMHQQGLLSAERLQHLKAAALEERLKVGDAEEYVALRKSGAWAEIEKVIADERSGTRAQREEAMRLVGADFAMDLTLSHGVDAKVTRPIIESFVAPVGEKEDDLAIYDHFDQLHGEFDKAPPPPPRKSPWDSSIIKVSDDDAHARDFRLRVENTKGTREWSDSHDAFGVKRAADGRIISEKTLRADADRPKRAAGSDRGDGHVVEGGVETAGETSWREAEQAANDAAAQAAAEPQPDPPEQPVILPNPDQV